MRGNVDMWKKKNAALRKVPRVLDEKRCGIKIRLLLLFCFNFLFNNFAFLSQVGFAKEFYHYS